MDKVLVFTGAGMSVPLGLPSTMDFMLSVNSDIKPITQYIVEYLGSSGEDIEWILSTLESFKSETALTEFLLPKISMLLGNDIHIQNSLPRINSQLFNLKSQATSEITRIKKIIFDKLGQYKPEQALALYFNL